MNPRIRGMAGSPARSLVSPSTFHVQLLKVSSIPSVGPVAQWLERAAHNRLVAGSNPAGPTIWIRTEKARRAVAASLTAPQSRD